MSENLPSRKKPTTEFLVYLIILLISAALRFLLLGKLPLDDHEAGLALQALKLSRGEQVLLSGEPGYIGLTTALFFIFNATEFTARFWPAVAGTLLTLIPVFFRKQLGKPVALILAFLIAMDPFLIGVSRYAEGSALALLGLLAAFGFGLKKRPLLSGLSLGMALAGGGGLWPGVIVLAGLLALNRKKFSGMSTRHLVLIAVSAGITLLTISTIFLTNPSGISAFGSSIVEYARSWGKTNGAALTAVSATWFLSLLPLLILAIWGLIDGLVRGDERVKWLGIWAGAALLLALVNPARQFFDLYWVSIPLLTLAAIKLAALFTDYNVENRMVLVAEAGLVVTLVVFSFLNTVNLVNNPMLNQEEYRNRVIGIILPLILLLGMTVLLAWGWSGVSTRKGLVAGAGILIVIFILSNASKAASLGDNPAFEVRRDGAVAVGNVDLISTIKGIALLNTGVSNRIDLEIIGLDLPSLEWALRDFDQTRRVSSFDPSTVPSIAVTPIDQQITASASYRGQKLLWQVKPDLKNMKFVDWMRWLLFRTAPIQKTEILLWARNDLFPVGTTP